MHRNTFIFVIILAILSAFVAGINISNRLHPRSQTAPTPTPIVQNTTPSPTEGKTGNERKQMLSYDNAYCGISLSFDTAILQFHEEASNSAVFINISDPNDTIVLGCQNDIPRPALTKENIETRTFGSISANLYHDSSAKDGTKIDAVIFTHPKNKLDVYIAGYGRTFEDLIATLTIR